MCCGLFYIISKTCFTIQDSNPNLVLSLSHHVKYLLISHKLVSQVLHAMTFERGHSGISDIRQSFCYPIQRNSFGDFMNQQKISDLLPTLPKLQIPLNSADLPVHRYITQSMIVMVDEK